GDLGAAECQDLEVLEALELNQALVADLRAGQEQHGESAQALQVLGSLSWQVDSRFGIGETRAPDAEGWGAFSNPSQTDNRPTLTRLAVCGNGLAGPPIVMTAGTRDLRE